MSKAKSKTQPAPKPKVIMPTPEEEMRHGMSRIDYIKQLSYRLIDPTRWAAKYPYDGEPPFFYRETMDKLREDVKFEIANLVEFLQLYPSLMELYSYEAKQLDTLKRFIDFLDARVKVND